MKLIFSVLFVAASLTLSGQAKIQVTIQNLQNTKGAIRVGLFNSEESFLEKAIEGKIVKASAAEVVVEFTNLKPGDYAVSVIHDENENGELDSNGLGMPKEGFGFGNNAMGFFGPPSFEKAKVVLKETAVAQQIIKLKYL